MIACIDVPNIYLNETQSQLCSKVLPPQETADMMLAQNFTVSHQLIPPTPWPVGSNVPAPSLASARAFHSCAPTLADGSLQPNTRVLK